MSAPYLGERLRVANTEDAAVREGRVRIRIGAVLFLAVLIVIVVRLGLLALFGERNGPRNVPSAITTVRADITDREGRVLATTLPTYSLYAEPRRVWNPEATADAILTARPELDRAELLAKLSSDRAFVWIERGLTPRQRQSVFALGQPGLDFRSEPKRLYPQGHLASHVTGFTDIDMVGMAGAEAAFQDELASNVRVALSIDLNVQQAVTEELAAGLAQFEAISNAAVVLNIKTGEVLGMASLPNFDPNAAGQATDRARYNTATMSTYDLGSVFKPLTTALALETRTSDLVETFPVHEPLRVRDKWIRDDHPVDVPLNMADILAESSNRGTVLMAQRAGSDAQQSFFRDLGLFDRVPYGLRESAAPQVQTEWQDITLATVAYGHGISVSPLALAVAVGAVLNGGVYVQPTILKTEKPLQARRVVRANVSDAVADLMRFVVTDGTGGKANVPGYGVMGKTGTADKPAIGGYDERRLVTSFVAAFPYRDPTYVVMVTFDEPKAVEGTHGWATAGWNAAPTAGAIIERIAPLLGVERRTQPIAMSPFLKNPALN